MWRGKSAVTRSCSFLLLLPSRSNLREPGLACATEHHLQFDRRKMVDEIIIADEIACYSSSAFEENSRKKIFKRVKSVDISENDVSNNSINILQEDKTFEIK